MLHYEIAGICFDIENAKPYISNRMEIFEKKRDKHADVSLNLLDCDVISLPESNTIIEESLNLNWVEKRSSNKGFYVYKTRTSTGEILDLLDTDSQWENASISLLDADYYVEYKHNPIEIVAFHLIGTMFRNRILFHKGIVIHASSIVYEGKGLVFTAPSGTGKSTHVSLWETHKGARVLNDDTPPIRLIDNKPFVYGSPWSGSSDKFLNEKAPLAAIFVLEQAPVNSIKSLSKQEIITRLMPRLFLPYFNNELMELAIYNFESIVNCTPVYLLKCRPDIEAMELVYECVK